MVLIWMMKSCHSIHLVDGSKLESFRMRLVPEAKFEATLAVGKLHGFARKAICDAFRI